MKRILVYSHDTFGLGNIRRMLTICEYLVASMPDASVLLITGSPVIHSFRLPPRLDYVKIPTLTRKERDEYAAKYLGTAIGETIQLRSSLILQAAKSFQPDVVLVDKKPIGVKHELRPTLEYLKSHHPATKLVLILRDILDSAEATKATWSKHGYTEAITSMYDEVHLLGSPDVFDAVREYGLPQSVAKKVRWTGYLRRPLSTVQPATIRQSLGIALDEHLVVVTPGGGQDGAQLLATYIASLAVRNTETSVHSLIVTGPEMSDADRATIHQAIAGREGVRVIEFTDDLMAYLAAADVVVAMGGYNTICEILSVGKPAVIVPRAKPVEEQRIRAERMAAQGLFMSIDPDDLTPERLKEALATVCSRHQYASAIDLDGLPRIAAAIEALLETPRPMSLRSASIVDTYGRLREYVPYLLVMIAGPTFALARGLRWAWTVARLRHGGWT